MGCPRIFKCVWVGRRVNNNVRTGGGRGPGVRLPCTEREGGVGDALRPVHERRGHRRRGEESAVQPPGVRLVPLARVSAVLTKVPSQRDRAVLFHITGNRGVHVS